MSEKKPKKGKGQFKVKLSIINMLWKNLDKIIQLRAEANRYLKDQNYEEAIKSCDELIKLDSENKTAYVNRGDAYTNLKNYDKAIIDYTKAIDLDPNHKYAHNNRGFLYNLLGEYKKAIVDLDKAILLNQNFKTAYFNRGVSYYNLRDYDKAMSDLNKAIEIDPNYRKVYNNRGVCYYELKDYDKALSDFDKAIDLDKNYIGAYNNRGVCYYELKDYGQALSDFDKGIDLDSANKSTYNNRGNVYRELKDYNKAINNYTKAIELDPNLKEAYFNRALVYSNLENYDKALDDFTLYVEYTDLVLYKLYFLLIDLYKTKKIDGKNELYNDKITDIIKKIINKHKNDSFESKKTNYDEKTNEIIDIIKDKDKNQIEIDPKTLYSYMPFNDNTKDAIVRGYKYANEIFDFNDPTDPTIKLIGEEEDKEEMRELLKNIRIACFSTSPLNALMYSHYTDKHKGISIEYDFSNFNKKDTTTSTLLEVKYKEELKIDSEISQISMKSDDDTDKEISFLDLFRTKHLNWEYEKEYRVITYDVDKIGKENLTIKAIYLGKDFPEDNIELITELIKDKDIKLYQVRLHEHNVFRLEAEEL